MGKLTDAFRSWSDRRLKAAAKPAAVPASRQPYPRGGANSSGWGKPQWWGDGIDGYDTLLEHSGKIDYDQAVGRYTANSVAAACLSWITTSLCSCPLVVGRMVGGEFEPVDSHPALERLKSPSPDFGMELLLPMLLGDLWEWGNAYWHVVRTSPSAPPTEIQFLRACETVPREDPTGKRLIGFYRYSPAGVAQGRDLPAENVIHFRYPEPDPDDPRLGVRPLRAVAREIYTDNLASEVSAAIMRRPRPSGILSPEKDVEVDDDDMDAIKRRAEELSSSERAGSILGLSAGIKFTAISYDPKSLAVDEQRRKPEERICARFGIPPVVVGIGAGLDRSTYNNTAAAKKSAWEECVGPLQDLIAATLTNKLLPMFGDPGDLVIRFDRSSVGVLQDDQMALRTEAREDVKAGIISVDEARAQQGLSGPAPTPPPAPDLAPPADPAPTPAKSLKQSADAGRLYRVAGEFRAALLADEEATLADMAAQWRRLLREVQTEIDQLAITAQDGQIDEMQRRLMDLMPQIEGALSDLADRCSAVVSDGQRAAIARAVGGVESLARAAVGTAPKPGASLEWRSLPTETFEALVGLSGNGSPVLELLQAAAGDHATALRGALLYAVGTGQGPRETGRTLAGITGTTRARLDTIARTEMNRAAREATRAVYAANADLLDGYVRVSAQDTRTCPACWALHGKKYPVGDPFAIHPNCRCTLVPAMKSWGEILGDDTLPDTRPLIEDGETLFGRLSADAQEEILGPGRFEAFQAGLRLADMAEETTDPEWGPTVATRTVADARART